METPELFNVFIEAAMDDLVVSWNERGMEMYFEAHGMVNHAIWADNIFLFASSAEQQKQMAQALANALEAWELRWKFSSLQVMLCGNISKDVCDLSVQLYGTSLTYKQVVAMEVLGGLVSNACSTRAAQDHRIVAADSVF